MVPAIISSIVILYLYWRHTNETKPRSEERATVSAVRSELANLNARLDRLQKRITAR